MKLKSKNKRIKYTNNFGKKGELYKEYLVLLATFVVVGFVVYFSTLYVGSAKHSFNKMAPELNYQFPSVFVHSFLMYPISEDDVRKLNMDNSTQHFVKDVIIQAPLDVEDIVSNYRDKYIAEQSSSVSSNSQETMFDYYKDFSGNKFDKYSLLQISYDVASIPNLEEAIKNDNYFFYIKNANDKYTIVYFK